MKTYVFLESFGPQRRTRNGSIELFCHFISLSLSLFCFFCMFWLIQHWFETWFWRIKFSRVFAMVLDSFEPGWSRRCLLERRMCSQSSHDDCSGGRQAREGHPNGGRVNDSAYNITTSLGTQYDIQIYTVYALCALYIYIYGRTYI